MANKYLGANSCYALNEGVYIPNIDDGVTSKTAPSILALLLLDKMRGYTYDDKCRKIKMDSDLFDKRSRFLKLLAYRHGGSKEGQKVSMLVDYVHKKLKLPEDSTVFLKGINAQSIGKLLKKYGITNNVRVEEKKTLAIKKPVTI